MEIVDVIEARRIKEEFNNGIQNKKRNFAKKEEVIGFIAGTGFVELFKIAPGASISLLSHDNPVFNIVLGRGSTQEIADKTTFNDPEEIITHIENPGINTISALAEAILEHQGSQLALQIILEQAQ